MAASDLHFDEHQFQNKKQLEQYPVHARQLHDHSYQTSQLDFGDYRRMSTQLHNAPGAGRRKATPTWVYSKEKLQHLVVVHMEKRSWVKFADPKLSLSERLAVAQRRWDTFCRPRMIEIITRLSREFVQLKREGRDPERQARLAIQVENIDVQLTVKNWPALFLRVVYLYHAAGMDSVGISAELNGALKPPSIRQLICRAGKIAEEIFAPGYVMPTRKAPKPHAPVERYCLICQIPINSRHGLYCKDCRRKPKPVRHCFLCGDEIRIPRGRVYCGKTCRRRAESISRRAGGPLTS